MLFGTWLDVSPFSGLGIWRSGSSVLHALPPGHQLDSSRMRSVLEDLRISDSPFSSWLGTLGGHDAFAAIRHRRRFHCHACNGAGGVLLHW